MWVPHQGPATKLPLKTENRRQSGLCAGAPTAGEEPGKNKVVAAELGMRLVNGFQRVTPPRRGFFFPFQKDVPAASHLWIPPSGAGARLGELPHPPSAPSVSSLAIKHPLALTKRGLRPQSPVYPAHTSARDSARGRGRGAEPRRHQNSRAQKSFSSSPKPGERGRETSVSKIAPTLLATEPRQLFPGVTARG